MIRSFLQTPWLSGKLQRIGLSAWPLPSFLLTPWSLETFLDLSGYLEGTKSLTNPLQRVGLSAWHLPSVLQTPWSLETFLDLSPGYLDGTKSLTNHLQRIGLSAWPLPSFLQTPWSLETFLDLSGYLEGTKSLTNPLHDLILPGEDTKVRAGDDSKYLGWVSLACLLVCLMGGWIGGVVQWKHSAPMPEEFLPCQPSTLTCPCEMACSSSPPRKD